MTDDSETDSVQCLNCSNWITPYNPNADGHLCRECLREIQVGDRVEQ